VEVIEQVQAQPVAAAATCWQEVTVDEDDEFQEEDPLPGPTDPSPEDVRSACLEIQSLWSSAERLRRSRGQAGGEVPAWREIDSVLHVIRGWTPPVCRMIGGVR
jgi:hypothetical protein